MKEKEVALTNAYHSTVKNFDAIMNSVLTAKDPERFTGKFLENLKVAMID